jgi:arylsulfatase A-like enzyme
VAGWLVPGIEEPFEPQTLAAGMWERVRLQWVAMPLVGHLPGVAPGRYSREQKIARFRDLEKRAREMVADPRIGLALIHLPVPHPPAIYDRVRGAFSAENAGSYIDNVALADRTLGGLRQSMEAAGLWDRTTVIVSADHGWRTAMWRGSPEWTAEDESASHQGTMGVPFLVKLPGQTTSLVYDARFETVVTRRLIGGILSGKVKHPAGLAAAIGRAVPR